ncbi:hypothetical protein R1sor_020670 [Riccia sorocarpa]|uniref:Sulfite oxidase n=1 Tax=Riccia sorocarpa TaxID=122646 RepID=A0ABD3GGZ2_9MARC
MIDIDIDGKQAFKQYSSNGGYSGAAPWLKETKHRRPKLFHMETLASYSSTADRYVGQPLIVLDSWVIGRHYRFSAVAEKDNNNTRQGKSGKLDHGAKFQKSKTLSLGRLATLSTIKDNLKVKTSYQKGEVSSPRASDQPNGSNDGGDGDSILLFSAISGYKEKTPTSALTADQTFGSFRGTDSPRRSSLSRDKERASSFRIDHIPGIEVYDGDSSMDYRDLSGPIMLREPPVEGREAEEEGNGEVGLQRGEIISTARDFEEEEEEIWQFPPKVTGLSLDRRDQATDDKWVPRHPELIRINDNHPFNAEPPLSTLMHFGFLTPTSLHYVRNRGAVPQAGWESWTIEVTGLVDRPKKFTMRDLLCFPSRRLPVTLMCSGNRSKELCKDSKITGLKWGPGAVSTSVWGGARLCDVLQHCGVHMPKKRGLQYFVCCSGADKPIGTNKKTTSDASSSSSYGTSIPLEVALDESRDVLLAYEQNGDLLTPDHGFPVRLIVPGFTGGRSVKWLNKIEISAEPSDNYYHLHDNRMLPSQVLDLETAISEGWMSKPEFTINEMNVNSVICTPAHSQSLIIDRSNEDATFSITGYAYSGSGKKISRVEVSLDSGKTWNFCSVGYPTQPTKHGKYWSWCFWETRVDVKELVERSEIVVRAWDSAMNTQPETPSWNFLGTMNNCWYRVKIHREKLVDDPQAFPDEQEFFFEHPTQPADLTGGWLDTSQALVPEEEKDVTIKLIHQESSSNLDLGTLDQLPSPATPLV